MQTPSLNLALTPKLLRKAAAAMAPKLKDPDRQVAFRAAKDMLFAFDLANEIEGPRKDTKKMTPDELASAIADLERLSTGSATPASAASSSRHPDDQPSAPAPDRRDGEAR